MASRLASPSRKEIERGLAAAKSMERKVYHSPDRASVEKEFGKDNVKDDPKGPPGAWVCTIKHDKAKMLRAEQMLRGVRKEESERGKEYIASIEKEAVTFPDGSRREVYGHLLENTKNKVKGLRGVGRHGKAPTEYFGLTNSYGKYEQGPEGLWFVWNDGWEPTSLWPHQAKGDEQHDPDGNLWLRDGDDWKLAEE